MSYNNPEGKPSGSSARGWRFRVVSLLAAVAIVVSLVSILIPPTEGGTHFLEAVLLGLLIALGLALGARVRSGARRGREVAVILIAIVIALAAVAKLVASPALLDIVGTTWGL